MVSNEQINSLSARVAKLEESIDIEQRRIDLQNEQERTEEPNFWDDPDAARKQLKKVADIKATLDEYAATRRSVEDLELIPDFVAEGVITEAEAEAQYAEALAMTEKMELKQMLSGKEDKLGAIMDINAGAGGTEACDWTGMLYRMYTRWAERRGFKVEELDYQDGDEAGIKSVSWQVNGLNAYGYLKSEKGVHRLVRISPFNAQGKRQTSFVSLDVMPEIEEDLTVEINPEDLRIDTYRSSGAGGQHINKTSSAIRITHLPTGIVVQCQNERSQFHNKEKAMQMLKAKLYLLKQEENAALAAGIRGEVRDINFGNQIRSYVLQPYTMVKDHRTDCEVGNAGAVLDGGLQPFINAYLKSASAGELKNIGE